MPNTNFSRGVSDASYFADSQIIQSDNSFQPSPTIYIPSGHGFFEKRLSIAGASLNGSSDDSSAFQSALNAIPSGKFRECHIPRGVDSIKINSGITIDASRTNLDFGGCLLDASGMTSGVAVTVTGTGTQSGDQSYGQCMSGINRMRLLGPGRYTNVDGILMTGSANTPIVGSARTMVSNSWIRNFRKGVTFYHRAYLSTFFNCEIGSHLIAVYSKGGGTDAYENVGLLRCVVGNSDMNVYVEDGYLHFTNCSIDYAEFVQMAVRAGMLSLNDCHVEFAIKNGQYGLLQNANNSIYSGIAPLCAIDLAPGNSVALRNDIDLTYTTASSGHNFAAFRMNGGHLAITPAIGTTSTPYRCIVNVAGGAQAYFGGKIRMNVMSNVPTSGYFAHTLTAYNTTGNFSGNVNYDPGCHFNTNDDIPNLMVETPSHLTGTLDRGYSISPANNMFGSSGFASYQTTGNSSFESTAGIMDDLCITEDSNASTSVTIPSNRLTGTAGSAAIDTAFANSGTRSLKLTKNAGSLATHPLKFSFTFPARPGTHSRPVFRYALGKPASGAPASGFINIAFKYIKPEFKYLSSGEIRTNPLNGASFQSGSSYATAASSAATHSSTGIKMNSGSMYIDVATIPSGGWVYGQLNSDTDVSYQPAWASHIQIDIDLKGMGPGQINLDQLDLQYM